MSAIYAKAFAIRTCKRRRPPTSKSFELIRATEAVLLPSTSRQAPERPLLIGVQATGMKQGDPETFGDVYYYTRERIARCASALITIAILLLLIVPVWLLWYIVTSTDGTLSGRATAICIGTLLVATLLFSAVLTLFTKAQRHEIFAAAAA